MFTDFWKIDLGTALAITIPLAGALIGGVYRICRRLFAIEEKVADQGERQERRFQEVAEKLGERNALQDQRHRENQDRLDRMERILMERRPGR